ncbi:MAG: hypothetical protein WC241_00150 [Candidatus Paceibacterota bacterium]|jgi:hypothetical protein
MKKVTLVVLQVTSGVWQLIVGKLKKEFPGVAYEIKFGKHKDIRLETFLEVPFGKELIIFVDNPFQPKDYLGSQSFETWIYEIAEEFDSNAEISSSSFFVSSEKYLDEGISLKEMERIFGDELNICKKIHANMPYSGSFDPQQATDSIFRLK